MQKDKKLKKNMKTDDLAVVMRKGLLSVKDGIRKEIRQEFQGVRKETRREIEGVKKELKQEVNSLAAMVQNGFLEVGERIDKLEKNMKSEIEDVKIEIGQKVHIFDHKGLEFRVERPEEKVGIARKR